MLRQGICRRRSTLAIGRRMIARWEKLGTLGMIVNEGRTFLRESEVLLLILD